MEQVRTHIAEDEYHTAFGTVRAAKNWFWWLILAAIVIQIVCFVLVCFAGVIDQAADVAPLAAASKGKAGAAEVWYNILAWILPATKFIGPITFQALTGRRPALNMWALDDREFVGHIERTELADLIVIAPATANIIAKIAAGIADDLMSTLVLSADSPVVLAPAMNERMWANPITQRNVAVLRAVGHTFIGPAEGRLACGTAGVGRMLEPREILDAIVPMLEAKPAKAAGKP